jgi:transcriptional regulator with XRE-family HTH domain
MMLLPLKIEILRRGISQAKLAQAIGRTPAHVSRLIRGRVRVRARDRRLIASFLGVSQARLFPSPTRSTRSTARPGRTRARVEGRRDA